MEKFFALALLVSSLCSGCAGYTLFEPTIKYTSREFKQAPHTEKEKAHVLAECTREIEKTALSFGGDHFVINEGDRKDLMIICMSTRGFDLQLASLNLQQSVPSAVKR